MCYLWRQVVDEIERQRLSYCVLRDGDDPLGMREVPPDAADDTAGCTPAVAPSHAEVDLLVDQEDVSRLSAALVELGFARLRRWGYAPHEFFVGYDKQSDCWLKLDVVTEITFGSPIHAIRTPLAAACLARRRQTGEATLPAPEDELVTLLLHSILDKQRFRAARRERIVRLCEQVTDEAYLSSLVNDYWPPQRNWHELRADIAAGEWDRLLAEGPALRHRLMRGQRMRAAGRYVRDRTLRKIGRMARCVSPETPMVALLAPDGAGKSSLAAELESTFYTPVELVYMGLYGEHERSRGLMRVVPGWGLARRILTQWGRYLRARYQQARGCLVLFDRYTYDALMPSRKPLSGLRRLRRWLLAHCCPHPDLVLVLDAPGEVLFARKGEHTRDDLERQRQAYRRLQSQLAHSVLVDATQEFDSVRRDVISSIWSQVARRGRLPDVPIPNDESLLPHQAASAASTQP